MTSPSDGDFPNILTDQPSPARMYDYGLGGKDNFPADRAASEAGLAQFPDYLVAARDNRRFLYRAVRFLAREAGIRQFLDLGSGLPTTQNVHQVAQRFQPDAHVVYVDNDPVVQAHGRALLASVRSAIVPGSYVAFTQMIGMTEQIATESTEISQAVGLTWKTRVAADIEGFFAGWELVEPGLVNVTDWRPDPDQPPLPPVPEPLRGFEAKARAGEQRLAEFGGVVHRR